MQKENNRIKWFARCGTLYPMGRLPFPLKALVLTRGPVCGDESSSRSALDALARYSKSEGFVFVEASPEVIPIRNPSAVDVFAQRDGSLSLVRVRPCDST